MASCDCTHQQGLGVGMPDSLGCLQSPQILFGTPLLEMLPPPCELLRSGMPHCSCWGPHVGPPCLSRSALRLSCSLP